MGPRHGLALALVLFGCSSPPPHPWVSPGTDTRLTLNIEEWEILAANAMVSIAPSTVDGAIALLAEREWVALDADQVCKVLNDALATAVCVDRREVAEYAASDRHALGMHPQRLAHFERAVRANSDITVP